MRVRSIVCGKMANEAYEVVVFFGGEGEGEDRARISIEGQVSLPRTCGTWGRALISFQKVESHSHCLDGGGGIPVAHKVVVVTPPQILL